MRGFYCRGRRSSSVLQGVNARGLPFCSRVFVRGSVHLHFELCQQQQSSPSCGFVQLTWCRLDCAVWSVPLPNSEMLFTHVEIPVGLHKNHCLSSCCARGQVLRVWFRLSSEAYNSLSSTGKGGNSDWFSCCADFGREGLSRLPACLMKFLFNPVYQEMSSMTPLWCLSACPCFT